MNTILSRSSILTKTAQVASMTMLSRMLGIIRVGLLARFLGVGIVSDAFLTAFMIPNSLRKMFAEGALSATFVPALVRLIRGDKKDEANKLISVSFLFFEGLLVLLCLAIFAFAPTVVHFFAPGFGQEQMIYAVPFLRILVAFIIFLSSSALLTGALQAVNHFWVPSFGPVLLNLVFIGALITCLWYSLPVEFLCYAILLSGLLLFALHLFVYLHLGFSFSPIDRASWHQLGKLLINFLPIFFSMSIVEVNLIIDTNFASYLSAGSTTLIQYANRFMGIPLGVFGVAFSTILLPHFSRITAYAPKRLGFYFLESMKFIFWVTIPVTIFMSLFAKQIFVTLFLSDKFPMDKVLEGQWVLIAFLVGLFFFSLNKVLMNIFYSLRDTKIPTITAVVATIFNCGMNYVLVKTLAAAGLALATSLSGIVQTMLLIFFLRKNYNFSLHLDRFMQFLRNFMMQLSITLLCFGIVYWLMVKAIMLLPLALTSWLTTSIGFWLWVGPLGVVTFLTLHQTRKMFGVKLYFLD